MLEIPIVFLSKCVCKKKKIIEFCITTYLIARHVSINLLWKQNHTALRYRFLCKLELATDHFQKLRGQISRRAKKISPHTRGCLSRASIPENRRNCQGEKERSAVEERQIAYTKAKLWRGSRVFQVGKPRGSFGTFAAGVSHGRKKERKKKASLFKCTVRTRLASKKKKKKKPDRSQRIPIVHTGYANLLLPIGANLHLPNHSRESPLLSRDPFPTSVSAIIDTTDTSRPLECYSHCQPVR